ncbi:TetR/AcrR family transcriptional regulator [Amycolatopsis saalfeldensis]|uniref:DNA-binding transcriptional regulator, AcrR family n=1 Tax=Amycolatopsis saalfeldensis TaxID=394193 RepID=A0A1H8YP97_9PSEU|nr:TetR/AcrR family transcriptional regulator [Amycolatopsis saalfeldensis]SEP53913.1 DNA-binding transcriptional regulator, AcrR family [Amycolatopsis saalfeldensis]
MREAQPRQASAVGNRSGKGRPPMTDRRKAIQRLEIARQAAKLFAAQGVAGTSGEQIADAVGISVRTLWRYFPTKESCVQPLLSEGIDAFLDQLRSWPAGTPLLDHLRAAYSHGGVVSAADAAARQEVVRMCREEPGLRAVWLQTQHDAEPTFAEVIAHRLSLPTEALEVRVQAGMLNVALRIAAEDQADGRSDGLIEAIRASVEGFRL